MIPEKTDQVRTVNARGPPAAGPVAFDPDRYKERNTVEPCFQKFKTWRGLATRYNKGSASYTAGHQLRGSIMWLKLLTSLAHRLLPG